MVVEPVTAGGDLLSWSTPFARARRDLRPGDCICTPSSLAALRDRGVTGLPDEPTAENVPLDPYELDESTLHVGEQVEPAAAAAHVPRLRPGPRRRPAPATTWWSSGPPRAAARSSPSWPAGWRATQPAGFDGVVPVAHTEAGEDDRPNNLDYVLATLAGFLLNPNVGAVLLVDEAGDVVTAADVAAFMREHDYPESRCRTRPSPAAAASRTTWPRPPRSSSRGSPRWPPSSAPSSRWPTCGSACSAAAPTPSRASARTRCPGRCRPRWCGTAAPRCSRRPTS